VTRQSELSLGLAQEGVGEQRDVVAASREWRDLEGHLAQPEQQIGAKPALGRLAL
jgi:hypothetical protein